MKSLQQLLLKLFLQLWLAFFQIFLVSMQTNQIVTSDNGVESQFTIWIAKAELSNEYWFLGWRWEQGQLTAGQTQNLSRFVCQLIVLRCPNWDVTFKTHDAARNMVIFSPTTTQSLPSCPRFSPNSTNLHFFKFSRWIQHGLRESQHGTRTSARSRSWTKIFGIFHFSSERWTVSCFGFRMRTMQDHCFVFPIWRWRWPRASDGNCEVEMLESTNGINAQPTQQRARQLFESLRASWTIDLSSPFTLNAVPTTFLPSLTAAANIDLQAYAAISGVNLWLRADKSISF